jgi:hypothetical protein
LVIVRNSFRLSSQIVIEWSEREREGERERGWERERERERERKRMGEM